MICIDTNAVIAAMKGEPAHLMDRFRRALSQGELALSAIVLFELRYRVANSARPVENAERLAIFPQAPVTILSFEPEDAEEAGAIRAELKRAGTPIGPYDLLIAAQARRRNALQVTANAAEFARVPGLRTQDWAAA